MHRINSHMVIRRSLYFTLLIAVVLLTACAGPMGVAYTAASTGTLVTTGKTPSEHSASYITDADCSILNIFNNEYVCEYNRNRAITYNRNPL